jgi:hypothetical protein
VSISEGPRLAEQQIIFVAYLLALKLAGMAGGALSLVLILFSRFSPIGMKSITLPFPIFKTTFFRLFYNLIFFVFYHIALPALEILYFTVFLPEATHSEDNSTKDTAPLLNKKELTFFNTLLICASYAGVTWCASWFIVTRFFAQLFITGIAFGLMFLLLKVKKDRDFKTVVVARYALSLGVFIWLLWLAATRKEWFKRSQPEYMFAGNVKNIWARA